MCGAPPDSKETFVNDRTWGPKEEEISVNDKSGYKIFITTGLI